MLLLTLSLAYGATLGTESVASDRWCSGLERADCLSRAAEEGVVSVDDTPEGEKFSVRTSDYEEWLADKADAYSGRVFERFGEELSPGEAFQDALARLAEGDEPAPEGDWTLTPLSCTEGGVTTDMTADGVGTCKLIFGADSRTLISAPRSYPSTKQVVYVLRHLIDGESTFELCSGTFVDEFHVLTAGHCVYDTDDNDWIYANASNPDVDPADVSTPYGLDTGRGYVCLGDDIDTLAEFEDNCEMVESRSVLTGYPAAIDGSWDAVEHDAALLQLDDANHSTGLGDGAWMALSTITSAATLEAKTAISQGYPGATPGGSSNLATTTVTYLGDDYDLVGRDQFKTTGSVDSPTTANRLMTKLEAGHGQSGSGIFYYVDDATTYSGQAHYVIGIVSVLAADTNGNTSNDYTAGPTVGAFYDWVVGII